MNIKNIAQKLVAESKGILAADKSTSSMNKALAAFGMPEEEEVRRKLRSLLIEAEGMEQYVSGVILYDETIRQNGDSGENFAKILENKGVLPGIKVDEGLYDDLESEGEKLNNGLEGLSKRLKEYKSFGAVFTKWRALVTIDEDRNLPTEGNIKRMADILAEYARVVQEEGMVPMIEPEVLKKGNHSIETAERVTEKVLRIVFDAIKEKGVAMEGLILKTSMVVSGSEQETASPEEVAERTVRVLRNTVPEEVAGVVFLSGGQKPLEATENLQKIAELGPFPWGVTFSYDRAIQEPMLAEWMNKEENEESVKAIYLHRLKMNSDARMGTYLKENEQ